MADKPNAAAPRPARPRRPSGKAQTKTPKTPAPRDLLGEAFLAGMLGDFERHGAAVIEQVRSERPHDYLKFIASLLPKEAGGGGEGKGIPAMIEVRFVRPAG